MSVPKSVPCKTTAKKQPPLKQFPVPEACAEKHLSSCSSVLRNWLFVPTFGDLYSSGFCQLSAGSIEVTGWWGPTKKLKYHILHGGPRADRYKWVYIFPIGKVVTPVKPRNFFGHLHGAHLTPFIRLGSGSTLLRATTAWLTWAPVFFGFRVSSANGSLVVRVGGVGF